MSGDEAFILTTIGDNLRNRLELEAYNQAFSENQERLGRQRYSIAAAGASALAVAADVFITPTKKKQRLDPSATPAHPTSRWHTGEYSGRGVWQKGGGRSRKRAYRRRRFGRL